MFEALQSACTIMLPYAVKEIIEDDSHKRLLIRNGHYTHLWNMQAGGFLSEYDEN
ncbi:MAG: hypothetical protein GY935_01755 [Gammaproteobacteria bacterium]|nr:hypothetical protein [Gammaproteobacteria bacterium]